MGRIAILERADRVHADPEGWIGPRLFVVAGIHPTTPHGLALAPDGNAAIWAGSSGNGPSELRAIILCRDAAGWFEANRLALPSPISSSATRAAAFDGETLVAARPGFGDVAGTAFVETLPPTDLDQDGLGDVCEIAEGLESDCDDDSVPDGLAVPFRHTVDNIEDVFLPTLLTVYQPKGVESALVLNHFVVSSPVRLRRLRLRSQRQGRWR